MPEGPEVRIFCDFLKNLLFNDVPSSLKNHYNEELQVRDVTIFCVNNIPKNEFFECDWKLIDIFSIAKVVYFVIVDENGCKRFFESRFGMTGNWGFCNGTHRTDKETFSYKKIELAVSKTFCRIDSENNASEGESEKTIQNSDRKDNYANDSSNENSQTKSDNDQEIITEETNLIEEAFKLIYDSKLNMASGFKEVTNTINCIDLMSLALGENTEISYEMIAGEILKYFRNSRKNIAQALLCQDIIGGIGNYIRSEAMFLSGIYPYYETRNMSIEAVANVLYCCAMVAQESYYAGGNTINDYFYPYIDEEGSFKKCPGNYKTYCFDQKFAIITYDGNQYQCTITRQKDNPSTKKSSNIYYCPEFQVP